MICHNSHNTVRYSYFNHRVCRVNVIVWGIADKVFCTALVFKMCLAMVAVHVTVCCNKECGQLDISSLNGTPIDFKSNIISSFVIKLIMVNLYSHDHVLQVLARFHCTRSGLLVGMAVYLVYVYRYLYRCYDIRIRMDLPACHQAVHCVCRHTCHISY